MMIDEDLDHHYDLFLFIFFTTAASLSMAL